MSRKFYALVVLLVCLAVLAAPAAAQKPERPVVRAVLFFSPSCPHCHDVINEFLVPLLSERSDELEIIGIDITSEAGQALYNASTDYYQVPKEMQGVPRLVVGDRFLVGSVSIPGEFPAIFEEGLAAGGIDWPPIPGLAEAMAASEQAAMATREAAEAEATAVATPAAQAAGAAAPQPEPTPTELQATATPQVVALGSEGLPPEAATGAPEGAGLAWAILAAMLLALLLSVVRMVAAGSALFSLNPGLHSLAKSWLIPLLAVVGLAVAGYLAYVEITHTAAVCGPVGDCNTVQASEYARIAGIPVAVLGLVNYVAVLVLWALQFVPSRRWSGLAARGLLALTLAGLLFSIYLTLLELFVIHAVCAWCLTSAVITTALMLLALFPLTSEPAGKGTPPRQHPAPA